MSFFIIAITDERGKPYSFVKCIREKSYIGTNKISKASERYYLHLAESDADYIKKHNPELSVKILEVKTRRKIQTKIIREINII